MTGQNQAQAVIRVVPPHLGNRLMGPSEVALLDGCRLPPVEMATSKTERKYGLHEYDSSIWEPSKMGAFDAEGMPAASAPQDLITQLQQTIRRILMEKGSLEKTVSDLREQNLGLAKRLACNFIQRKPTDANHEGANNPEISVDELNASIAKLDLMVLSRDAEIEEMTNRQKTTHELIIIMREQIIRLQNEKSNLLARHQRENDKVERKNAALKESIKHCDETIERMRRRTTKNEASEDASATAIIGKTAAEGEKETTRELLQDQAQSQEIISCLRRKLRDATNALEKAATATAKEEKKRLDNRFTKAESVEDMQKRFTDALNEEKRRSGRKLRELEQNLSHSNREAQLLREENDTLKRSSVESGQDSAKHIDPAEEFSIFKPLVKNLEFLLQVKDKTLKEAREERDEALKEIEKKALEVKHLKQYIAGSKCLRVEVRKTPSVQDVSLRCESGYMTTHQMSL